VTDIGTLDSENPQLNRTSLGPLSATSDEVWLTAVVEDPAIVEGSFTPESGWDLAVTVFDDQLAELVDIDEEDSGQAEVFARQGIAGRYFFSVTRMGTGSGGDGPFTFSVSFSCEVVGMESEPNDMAASANVVEELPETLFGSLSSAADSDWFTFSLEAPAMLSIETLPGGEDVDTELWLYSDAGTIELANDDDGGEYYFSLIEYLAQPGDYWLKVGCTSAEFMCEPGDYLVSISAVPVICEPGAARCTEDSNLEVCNENGTEWQANSCVNGCALDEDGRAACM